MKRGLLPQRQLLIYVEPSRCEIVCINWLLGKVLRAGKQLCSCELDRCQLVDVLTMESLHGEKARSVSFTKQVFKLTRT